MSGTLLRKICSINYFNSQAAYPALIYTSACVGAARKGTREKARKKKVKVELKKVGFIPHNVREQERLKSTVAGKSKRSVEVRTDEPLDSVFCHKYYKHLSYPVTDAVQFHREINHPTMFNRPNAPVKVTIELNMVAEKKTRFMDSFNRIVHMPHPFGTYEDRTVLAFCKTPEQVEEALQAGADVAGGNEIIHKIQSGDLLLPEFKFVVSHPAILPELVPIRGLLKRKFPVLKNGTLGPDLKAMITKYKLGLQYRCEKDEDEHELGVISTDIGSLDMDPQQLEENFRALVWDVEDARPRRGGDFITWVWSSCAPSPEKLKIDHLRYMPAPTVS